MCTDTQSPAPSFLWSHFVGIKAGIESEGMTVCGRDAGSVDSLEMLWHFLHSHSVCSLFSVKRQVFSDQEWRERRIRTSCERRNSFHHSVFWFMPPAPPPISEIVWQLPQSIHGYSSWLWCLSSNEWLLEGNKVILYMLTTHLILLCGLHVFTHMGSVLILSKPWSHPRILPAVFIPIHSHLTCANSSVHVSPTPPKKDGEK